MARISWKRALMAFQAVDGIFAEERAEAEQSGKLGPMLPEDYRDARRIFLEDLGSKVRLRPPGLSLEIGHFRGRLKSAP